MSELDDAIARLEAAITRLEVAASQTRRAGADDAQVTAVAEGVAERLDAALVKLGQLLDKPE